MNKLVIFELKKLFRSKPFYICIAISVLLEVMNCFLNQSLTGDMGSVNDFVLGFISGGMVVMILGIFTSIFVSEDFAAGTIKNIIAKGYSRREVYFAKLIVTWTGSLILSVIVLITGFIAGFLLLKGENTANSTFVISLILETFVALAYATLFFALAISIGKLGLSIVFAIIGPSVITLLLTLADSNLKLENISFSSYWLDGCLSSLAVADCTSSAITTSIVVSLVVIVLSTIIGNVVYSKKEF